jgi:hypothetical protein
MRNEKKKKKKSAFPRAQNINIFWMQHLPKRQMMSVRL